MRHGAGNGPSAGRRRTDTDPGEPNGSVGSIRAYVTAVLLAILLVPLMLCGGLVWPENSAGYANNVAGFAWPTAICLLAVAACVVSFAIVALRRVQRLLSLAPLVLISLLGILALFEAIALIRAVWHYWH